MRHPPPEKKEKLLKAFRERGGNRGLKPRGEDKQRKVYTRVRKGQKHLCSTNRRGVRRRNSREKKNLGGRKVTCQKRLPRDPFTTRRH